MRIPRLKIDQTCVTLGQNILSNPMRIGIVFQIDSKDLSETKMTRLGVGHSKSISGHFSASYINSFYGSFDKFFDGHELLSPVRSPVLLMC